MSGLRQEKVQFILLLSLSTDVKFIIADILPYSYNNERALLTAAHNVPETKLR